MKEVTRILQCIDQGDASAAERLLERVHSKLKQLAVAQCPSDPAEYSRHAAALVHELYLRLVDVEQVESWSSRVRFFSAAAEAMRRIAREAVRDHCERDTEGARECSGWGFGGRW